MGIELLIRERRLRFVLGRTPLFSQEALATVAAAAGGMLLPCFSMDPLESNRLALVSNTC
jgi:hypothetical protein